MKEFTTMVGAETFDAIVKEEFAAAFKRIDERLKKEFDATVKEKGLPDEQIEALREKHMAQIKKTNEDYVAQYKKMVG